MTVQWQDELESEVRPRLHDHRPRRRRAMRRQRGFARQSWTTGSRFIISHSLLTDETYSPACATCSATSAPAPLLILDEAHHAAPSSGARYAIRQPVHAAIRDLARALRAPPVPLRDAAQRPLQQLLGAARNARSRSASRAASTVEAARSRAGDGPPPEDRSARLGEAFPERGSSRSRSTACRRTRPSWSCARRLAAYGELREQRHRDAAAGSKAALAKLVFVGLQQRLLSSIAAFAAHA